MKNGLYESRAEQVLAIVKEVYIDCKAAGCPLPGKARRWILDALKRAAFCGACGERDRTLELLRSKKMDWAVATLISKSIKDVLGFPTRSRKES